MSFAFTLAVTSETSDNMAGVKLLLLSQAVSIWSTPPNTNTHTHRSALGAHHLSPRAQAEGRQIVLAVFLQVPLHQTHTLADTHVQTICPLTYCSNSIALERGQGAFTAFISEEY